MIDAVIGAVLAFTVPEICVYFSKHLSEEEKIQCYIILTVLSLMILMIYNFWLNLIEESYQRQLFQTVSVVMTSVMIKFIYPLLFIGSQPPVAGTLVAVVLIATLFLTGKWKEVKMVLQQGMALLTGGVYFLMKFEEYLNPILRFLPYFLFASKLFLHSRSNLKLIENSFAQFLGYVIAFFVIFCEPVNYVYGFDTILLESLFIRCIVSFVMMVIFFFLIFYSPSSSSSSGADYFFSILVLANYMWIIIDDLILVNYFPEYRSMIQFLMKGLNICQYYALFKLFNEEKERVVSKNQKGKAS